MGVYDSFFARCAKCGTELEVQVKAWDSCCMTFYKGDTVNLQDAPDNWEIDDRHACYYCGHINTIIVKDRIFLGFKKIGE